MHENSGVIQGISVKGWFCSHTYVTPALLRGMHENSDVIQGTSVKGRFCCERMILQWFICNFPAYFMYLIKTSKSLWFLLASSSGQGKPTHAACIKAVSPDSVMSSPVGKVDSSLCIPVRQARSSLSLSFSNLTGESSAGDYQDCGMSSMLFMGEPSWYPTGPECSSLPGTSRDTAITRYKEKKKTRK